MDFTKELPAAKQLASLNSSKMGSLEWKQQFASYMLLLCLRKHDCIFMRILTLLR